MACIFHRVFILLAYNKIFMIVLSSFTFLITYLYFYIPRVLYYYPIDILKKKYKNIYRKIKRTSFNSI